MPLYRVLNRPGLLDADQRAAFSVDVVDVHCDVTGAPRSFVHVLYADEVQNFTHGVDFPTVLSEARKYHLALTIATQTLAQLPSLTLSAVFGNCATIISYRVSGEDADALQTEFATMLPARLLQDLPDFKLYIKTLMNSQGATKPHEPKLVKALPPLTADDTNTRENIIRTSLQRFSRPRAEVEAKLNRFIRA